MIDPTATGALALGISFGGIVLAGTLGGLLVAWIESRIQRDEH